MRERIDPTNLGEVLACAGIARLAWRRDPHAKTGFEDDEFVAPDDALDGLVAHLAPTPTGFDLCGLAVDWWQSWGMNPGLKNWSGNQSPESVHRASVDSASAGLPLDWRRFAVKKTGGHLYVDTATGWDTLGLGWSIDAHDEHQIAVRPWLEILASLGLQAMPVSGERKSGFCYRPWPVCGYPLAITAFRVDQSARAAAPYYRSRTAPNGKNTYLLPAERIS